jgi:thiamine-monophosphate kinase
MAIKNKRPQELVLVDQIARRFKTRDHSVIVPIGDDAAAVRLSSDKCHLYTVDMLVEGTHFKKGEDSRKVGYKAMAVSVSDIAAMGGEPKYALVSVGIPGRSAKRSIRGLLTGLNKAARAYGVAIIGGDMNKSDRLVVDVFMVGQAHPGRLARRSGARSGDVIFVSGPLGGTLKGKHLDFVPRLDASRFLMKNFHVTSMMDLSDGLSMDLNRISAASRVGALIFETKIPLNKGVRRAQEALTGGEDFELLFTLSSTDARRLEQTMKRRATRLEFWSIGVMSRLFKGVRMISCDGRVQMISPKGFQHFS